MNRRLRSPYRKIALSLTAFLAIFLLWLLPQLIPSALGGIMGGVYFAILLLVTPLIASFYGYLVRNYLAAFFISSCPFLIFSIALAVRGELAIMVLVLASALGIFGLSGAMLRDRALFRGVAIVVIVFDFFLWFATMISGMD